MNWFKFRMNIGVGSPVRDLPTTQSDLVNIKTLTDLKKVLELQTVQSEQLDLDKLYPKWNCGVCGDWFHMPYKYCKCGKTQKHIDWSKVNELRPIKGK